ncbi:MAG: hypothetical protein R6V62_08125 [Candidatus Fermentibacteraceae bacterium]
MNRMLFPALLMIASGAATGRVLDICPASGDGAWLVVQSSTEMDEVSVSCLYLIEDGEAVLADTLGSVRSDAAHCRLIQREDGGCFSATSTGTGYTAISLRSYGPDGSVEWELVEDGDCYDEPLGLLGTGDGGVLMLWDSWSTSRGLWVIRVNREGEQLWRTFALPTLHPFFTALCPAGDGGCFVAAATVAVMDECVTVTLDSSGNERECISVGVLENLGARTPIAAVASDEGIISLWADTPVPESLDEIVVALFNPGSIESRWFSLDPLSGAQLLEMSDGGVIAAGGGDTPWVCTTDMTGTVTWHHRFETAFVPGAIDSGDGFILVSGDCETGFFAARVEEGTGEVWSLRQNN